MTNIYDVFEKAKANHVSLSPLSFLPRVAKIFPDRMAKLPRDR